MPAKNPANQIVRDFLFCKMLKQNSHIFYFKKKHFNKIYCSFEFPEWKPKNLRHTNWFISHRKSQNIYKKTWKICSHTQIQIICLVRNSTSQWPLRIIRTEKYWISIMAHHKRTHDVIYILDETNTIYHAYFVRTRKIFSCENIYVYTYFPHRTKNVANSRI